MSIVKREGVEWLACMVIASLALVWAIGIVPYIPTHDGPQHILSAHIENHYSDEGSLYPDFYRVLPQFAGKGFALVFGPLEGVLPWRVALRITISIVTVAFAWGFALVVLSLDSNRRPTAMLGFVIALPWSLYMGFFAFVVGTTLGLYTLAFVLRHPPTSNGRRAGLALLLLAQAVCHVFTAILTGISVAVLCVVGAPKGERVREAGRMALMGGPAAALLGLTFRDERGSRWTSQPVVDWALAQRGSEISRWFVPGPGVRGWTVIGLVLVGIGGTIVRRRKESTRPAQNEQAVAWLAAALFLLALLTPLHIPGWQCFAPRFALLATVFGLALVQLPERVSPRTTRALVPLVTLGCITSALVSANLHRELAEGCAEALAGLDAPLRFTGPRLPVVLDAVCGAPRAPGASPVPRAMLAANTPLLYLLDHGGIGTRIFNGVPSIHAVEVWGARVPHAPLPIAVTLAQGDDMATDPRLRAAVMTELAADGMGFEGIHVVGGRSSDFAALHGRGYVTELERGSLFIARFEGCPSELVLPRGSLDREPVYVEYGLFSRSVLTAEPRKLGSEIVNRDTPLREDGAIHVQLSARPCGEIWVRVVWDADRSSTLTAGERTCEGATWEGRLVANVTRERPLVHCIPAP